MEAFFGVFFCPYLHIPILILITSPVLQFRLANCASNYGLYDTYAYFFADDIDPNTGEVDAKIRVFDDLSGGDGGVVAAIQAKVSINKLS